MPAILMLRQQELKKGKKLPRQSLDLNHRWLFEPLLFALSAVLGLADFFLKSQVVTNLGFVAEEKWRLLSRYLYSHLKCHLKIRKPFSDPRSHKNR